VRQCALSGTRRRVVCETCPVSEQPGRYQRSASGMVGAMVVLLLVVGAFVGVRALSRDELEVEPERVDYLQAVGFAQESGWTVAYPPTVPGDWKATSVESQPGRTWGIGFLTPNGFAGLHQSEESSATLLETYVDEDTTELDPVEIDGEPWEVHEDAGGDRGYLGEVDGVPVLVYGSASQSVLQDLAASLTTAPVS
jgi:hypothetical protein